MTDEEKLIAKYIERNPHRPGADEVRLKPYGQSVWAIINYSRGTEVGASEVAAAYGIPEDAVRAAIAYYRRHRCIIDNHIAANLV